VGFDFLVDLHLYRMAFERSVLERHQVIDFSPGQMVRFSGVAGPCGFPLFLIF
jgi:hypothetical protein